MFTAALTGYLSSVFKFIGWSCDRFTRRRKIKQAHDPEIKWLARKDRLLLKQSSLVFQCQNPILEERDENVFWISTIEQREWQLFLIIITCGSSMASGEVVLSFSYSLIETFILFTFPTSNTYITTPSAHQSTEWSYFSPFRISGAVKIGRKKYN